MRRTVWLIALVACEEPAGRDERTVFSAEVGPAGGELAGGGLTLSIPAGALATAETLTLRVEGEPADGALSPVYRFEPEGLAFAVDAEVSIAVDGGLGTLRWSTADDPEAFEAVGLAAGGLAEGTTWHFSTAFVEEGVCTLPEPTCSCRASDGVEDLLCPVDPSSGVACDIDAFAGTDGGACTGFGPREVLETWCDCYHPQQGFLCPDAYVFDPQQLCPSERGLNGFHGSVGQACSGYTVDGQSLGGTVQSCSVEVVDTRYESVAGTLEGCTPTEARRTAQACEDAITEECLDILDDYGADRTEACPDVAPNTSTAAGTVGSVIGNDLEKSWKGQDPLRYTQLEVPFANKDDCKAGTAVTQRRSGKPDLFQVVGQRRDAVVVRVGDVKPLTRTGLQAGVRDLDCYVDAVTEAGAKCADPKDAVQQAFCDALGANGRPVVLDDAPGVKWDRATEPPLHVQDCAEGVVAYTCE